MLATSHCVCSAAAPVRLEGFVKNKDGGALEGAVVRVMESRSVTAKKMEPVEELVEATAGPDGHFVLGPLSDDQVYLLTGYAEGFEPASGTNAGTAPVELRLAPDRNKKPEGKFSLRAKVVGADSKPIAWARVDPDGVGTENGTGWGYAKTFPDHVFTDKDGAFVFARDQKFTRLQVYVEVPGSARAHLWLDTTNPANLVQLGPGGVIQGRVQKEGKPLADLRVGVSGSDRNSMVDAGHYETRTRADGTFVFSHLAPDTSWQLYGIIASFKAHGSLPPRLVRSGGDGQTNDLGDLEVTAALRLSGTVQARNGEPVPKDLKVSVSYETAWDSQSEKVDASGHFAFDGLHFGKTEVGIQQRGWRLSGENQSMDIYNSFRLAGLLEADKTDLVLLVEKGERLPYRSGSGNGQMPTPDRPENLPLLGAESSGPAPIILAGSVIDDKTGLPLPVCKIVPGYKPPVTSLPANKPVLQKILEPFAHKATPWNELPCWLPGRTQTFSNGVFSVSFRALTSTPMLQVEAPGYDPVETGPMPTNTANLVIRMKQGVGVNGVVLLPNGKPADKATLVYACTREQCSLTDGTLNAYGATEGKQTTGPDGKFAFPQRAQAKMLFVAHPAGWAEQPVERAARA